MGEEDSFRQVMEGEPSFPNVRGMQLGGEFNLSAATL